MTSELTHRIHSLPPETIYDIDDQIGEPSRNEWSTPCEVCPKGQGVGWTNHCKTKKIPPNGQMIAAPEVGCKLYESNN